MSESAPAPAMTDPQHHDPVLLDWSPTNAIAYGWRVTWGRPETIAFVLFATILAAIPDFVREGMDAATRNDTPLLATLFLYVVGWLLDLYFGMRLTVYYLKVMRGQRASLGDLFGGGPYFLLIAAGFLFVLCVVVGLAFLIVPGVILALGWSLHGSFVIDRGRGPIEALGDSWRATTGHKWGLFALMLLTMLLAIAGILACLIGIFIAIPIIYGAWYYTYLMLTSQPLQPFRKG